jgi:hypothetical protein
MINNILVELLRSFSKEELLKFGVFVNSPFYNKKTAVVNLFNYLKNFHPQFDDREQLDRKNIYRKLYPGKPFNYGVMKNIIYELNLSGEKFLEITSFSENKPEQFRHLLAELTDRKLNKAFKKNLKKADLILESGTRDDLYFRNKMDIELLRFNFHIKNVSRTEKPKFDLHAINYLILYFLAKFFKINYNNLVTSVNFGASYDIRFLDEVLTYIQKTPEIDPVILLYYNSFMLMYKENETTYREFKKFVKEQITNFGRKEQFNSYNKLLNYCYGKIVSGDWSYYKELFDIYNEMIANKIITISENDYFDAVHFRLAAETGIKLKKFGWVKRFIEQYSEKLPPKLKSNEINIALANYFLMKKNYDSAQKYLAQTHLYTAYDKVYIYIIQSMLHYETGQFENLISEVDSIRHFISNDKTLWVENRNSFLKYVRYLNELVKLNMKELSDRKAAVRKLKKSLISENGILEKGWLMEKLNALNRQIPAKRS